MEIGLLLEEGRKLSEPNKLGFAMSRCGAVCRVARERTALDERCIGWGGVLNFPLVWPKMIVVVMVPVMIIMMA